MDESNYDNANTSPINVWYKNYKIWLGVGIGVAVLGTTLSLYFLGVFDTQDRSMLTASIDSPTKVIEEPVSLLVPPPPPEVRFCSPRLYGGRYLEFGPAHNVWWTDKELRDPVTDELSFIIEVWYVVAADLILPEVVWLPKDQSQAIPLVVEPDTQLEKPGDRLYFKVSSLPLIRSMGDSLNVTVVKKSENEKTYTFSFPLASYEPLLSLEHRLNLDTTLDNSDLSSAVQIMTVTIYAPFEKKIPLKDVTLLTYIFPAVGQKTDYVFSDIEWDTQYIVPANDASKTLQIFYIAASPAEPEHLKVQWRLSQTDTTYNGGRWCMGFRTTNLITIGETQDLDIQTEWFGHTQPFSVVNLYTRYTDTLKMKSVWSHLSGDSQQIILTFVFQGLIPEEVTTEQALNQVFEDLDLNLDSIVTNNSSWTFLRDTDAEPISNQIIRGQYFHSWVKRYNINNYPKTGPAQVSLTYRHNVYEGDVFVFYNEADTTFEIPTQARVQGGSSLGYLYQIYYFTRMEQNGALNTSTEAQLYNESAYETWGSVFISIFNGPLSITEEEPLYIEKAPNFLQIVLIQMTETYIEYKVTLNDQITLPTPVPEFVYFTVRQGQDRVIVGLRFNPPADKRGQPLILQTARLYNNLTLQTEVDLGTLETFSERALYLRVYFFGGNGDYELPIPDDQTLSEVYAGLLTWNTEQTLSNYFVFAQPEEETETSLKRALLQRWINTSTIVVQKEGLQKYIRYELNFFHNRGVNRSTRFDFTNAFVKKLSLQLDLHPPTDSLFIYRDTTYSSLPWSFVLQRPIQYTPPVVSDIQIFSGDGQRELTTNVLQITEDHYQFLLKVVFTEVVKYDFEKHQSVFYKYMAPNEDTLEPSYDLSDRLTIDKIITNTEETEDRVTIGDTVQEAENVYTTRLTFTRPKDTNVYEINQLNLRYNYALLAANHELDTSVSASWNEPYIEQLVLKGVSANNIVIQEKYIDNKTPSFTAWCPGTTFSIHLKWYASTNELDANGIYPNIATLGQPNTRGLWEGTTLGYRRLVCKVGLTEYVIWKNGNTTGINNNSNIFEITSKTITNSGTYVPGPIYTSQDYSAVTALNGLLDTTATTINVINTSSFKAQGILTVGNERIFYQSKTATTFTGCVRGYGSTTTSEYSNNTKVQAFIEGEYIDIEWKLKLLKNIVPGTNLSFQLQQQQTVDGNWDNTNIDSVSGTYVVQRYDIYPLNTNQVPLPFYYHIQNSTHTDCTFMSTAPTIYTLTLNYAYSYTHVLGSENLSLHIQWSEGTIIDRVWSYPLSKTTDTNINNRIYRANDDYNIQCQISIPLADFGQLPIEKDVTASFFLTGMYSNVSWRIPYTNNNTFIGNFKLKRTINSITASSLYVYLPQVRHTQIDPDANPSCTVPELCRRMTLCASKVTQDTKYATLRAKDHVPRWFGGNRTLDTTTMSEMKVKPVQIGTFTLTEDGSIVPYFKLLSEDAIHQLQCTMSNGLLTWTARDVEMSTNNIPGNTPYFTAITCEWQEDYDKLTVGYNSVGTCYFECPEGDPHVPQEDSNFDSIGHTYYKQAHQIRNIHTTDKLGNLHMKQPWPKKVVFPKLQLRAVERKEAVNNVVTYNTKALFGVTEIQNDTLYVYGNVQQHMRGNTGHPINAYGDALKSLDKVTTFSSTNETKAEWRNLYKDVSTFNQYSVHTNEHQCVIQCQAIAELVSVYHQNTAKVSETLPENMTLVLQVADWEGLNATNNADYTLMHRNPLIRRSPGYTGNHICGHYGAYQGNPYPFVWNPTRDRGFLGKYDGLLTYDNPSGERAWGYDWRAGYIRAFDLFHGKPNIYLAGNGFNTELLIYPTLVHSNGPTLDNKVQVCTLTYKNDTATKDQSHAYVSDCKDWLDRTIGRLSDPGFEAYARAPSVLNNEIRFRHAGFRVKQWTPYTVYRLFFSAPTAQQLSVITPPTHAIERRFYEGLYSAIGRSPTVGKISTDGGNIFSVCNSSTTVSTKTWYGPMDNTKDISATSVQGYRLLPFDPLNMPPHGNIVVGSYKFADTMPNTWAAGLTNANVPIMDPSSTTTELRYFNHETKIYDQKEPVRWKTNIADSYDPLMSIKAFDKTYADKRSVIGGLQFPFWHFQMGFDLCTHDTTLVQGHWDVGQGKRIMTVSAVLNTNYAFNGQEQCG